MADRTEKTALLPPTIKTTSHRRVGSSSPKSPLDPHREQQFNAARAKNKAKNKRAGRALTGAIVFCFVFMVAEGIGGFLSHSLAVLTDAAHMLTDVGALSLALFSLHASSRPASDHYSYGWHRAEAVGALASVFTIWALVGAIGVNAVERIVSDIECAKDGNRAGCDAVDSVVMFAIGCGGLAANFCCAAILSWGGHHGHSHGAHGGHGHSHGGHGHGCDHDDHEEEHGHGHSHGSHDDHDNHEDHDCHDHHGHDHGHGHGHDHGHDHGHSHGSVNGDCSGHDHGEKPEKKKKKNLNIQGAFLHALGDCIQSVGVIIAAGIIWGYNKKMYDTPTHPHSWGNLADPCCSILFGIVTLYTTVGLFKELLGILMEGTPQGINFVEVMDSLHAIEGVESVHDLHIWSLTAENVVLSVHLVADTKQCHILKEAQKVCAKFGIEHTTIQIDPLEVNVTNCSTLKFQCAN